MNKKLCYSRRNCQTHFLVETVQLRNIILKCLQSTNDLEVYTSKVIAIAAFKYVVVEKVVTATDAVYVRQTKYLEMCRLIMKESITNKCLVFYVTGRDVRKLFCRS